MPTGASDYYKAAFKKYLSMAESAVLILNFSKPIFFSTGIQFPMQVLLAQILQNLLLRLEYFFTGSDNFSSLFKCNRMLQIM